MEATRPATWSRTRWRARGTRTGCEHLPDAGRRNALTSPGPQQRRRGDLETDLDGLGHEGDAVALAHSSHHHVTQLRQASPGRRVSRETT